MSITWDQVRRKIKNRNLESTTWLSNRKNLLAIIDAAEAMGIDPTCVNDAPISNLRDSIKAAKIAIRERSTEDLVRIFWLASTLNTYELRKQLGTLRTAVIRYRTNDIQGLKVIEFAVFEDEFAHIQQSTKRFYSFEELTQS